MIIEKVPSLEIFYLSVIPPNCILVSFYSILSIIIFSKTKFNNNIIYKYLIANSIIQLLLVLAILAYLPQQCNQLFKLRKEYEKYFFYIREYIFRIVSLLSLLVNLTISYIRYATINKPLSFNKCKFICIILGYLLFSIGFSLTNLIFFYYSSPVVKITIYVIQALVYITPIISIIVFNCMIIITTHLKTKKHQNEWALNYSSINLNRIQVKVLQIKLTKMIVFQSIIHIISLILIILFFLNESYFKIYTDEKLVDTIIHLIFFICCYISILIFYKFNKFFAFYFANIMKIIFTKSCSKTQRQARSRIYRENVPMQETQL